jgi:hypothetical protein
MSISYFLIIAFRLWANFLVLLLYCRRLVRRAFRPAVRIADVLRQHRRCARWPGSSGSSPWLTITDFNDPVGFFEHEFLDPILRAARRGGCAHRGPRHKHGQASAVSGTGLGQRMTLRFAIAP